MTALRVLPPDHYVGAVESIPLVVALVQRLEAAGAVYRVEDDLYFSVTADPAFGAVVGPRPRADARDLRRARRRPRPARQEGPARLPRCGAATARASRAGRARSAPAGPAGTSSARRSRWSYLGDAFDVQGGGSDLVFPHHEMCAAEAQVAEPGTPFARAYVHAGMVGYDGEKMSKSRGNLVFVSQLRARRRRPDGDPAGAAAPPLPRATGSGPTTSCGDAVDDLARWRRALSLGAGAPAGAGASTAVLAALADDLDAPTALAAVDAWVAATLGTDDLADTSDPDAALAVASCSTPPSAWPLTVVRPERVGCLRLVPTALGAGHPAVGDQTAALRAPGSGRRSQPRRRAA